MKKQRKFDKFAPIEYHQEDGSGLACHPKKDVETLDLWLIALGLSMDAFAVSLCAGLGLKKLRLRQMLTVSLMFGGFQALMPLIGWMLGKQFEQFVTPVDHWIAFLLLSYLGGKMIADSFSQKEEQTMPVSIRDGKLWIMAVATSIDALAVGITFAFLKMNVISAVTLIGLVTFVLCFVGVWIGHRFGTYLEQKAGWVGGVVLIGMGIKILLEHLGFFS